MRRTLTLFATLVLLWQIVVQLNHGLAARHIYLWVGGLFVAYGALHEPLPVGLGASALAGLLWDATVPVAFGTHLILFSVVHVFLFNLRDRLPREDVAAQVVIVLLVNLAAFLVFSFLQVSHVPAPATVWPRTIFDLICSQVVIALVTPWFIALQEKSLQLAAPNAERYERSFE